MSQRIAAPGLLVMIPSSFSPLNKTGFSVEARDSDDVSDAVNVTELDKKDCLREANSFGLSWTRVPSISIGPLAIELAKDWGN